MRFDPDGQGRGCGQRHMWNGPPGKRFLQTFPPAGTLRSYVRPHMRALASSYFFISTLLGFCHCGAVDLIDQGGAPIQLVLAATAFTGRSPLLGHDCVVIVPSLVPHTVWRSREGRSPRRCDPGFVVPLGRADAAVCRAYRVRVAMAESGRGCGMVADGSRRAA